MNNRIGEQVGEYTLLEFLGKGKYAKAYKVVKTSELDTEKFYCIKMLNKDQIDSFPKLQNYFKDEKYIMMHNNHPNILKMYECFVNENDTEKNYCLVNDYCNCGDLKYFLKKNGKIPETKAIYFIKQIFNGIIQ